MISNLPLLFADGQPTCLEKITVNQLEKFVPFMVQCSCGQSDIRKLTAPPWWPNGFPFSIPLLKPPVVEARWLQILKNLVCRCYSYHECDFMLRFCSDLSRLSIQQLKFEYRCDGTTSLYDKFTGKLLVTFRNENLFYDKRKSSPKKTLLCRNNGEGRGQNGMVQPPLYDLYLCDNCDEEFSTLKEVKDHEKTCSVNEREPSPPRFIEESEKESFLRYFNLVNSQKVQVRKKVERPLLKFRNTLRYSNVPISSPLGSLVYKKSKTSRNIDRVERYCPAKPSKTKVDHFSTESASWPVSWKPRRRNGQSYDSDWVHVYKKPARQWRGKKSVNKGCNKTENLLLQCRDLSVCVKRLTPVEIALYSSTSSESRKSSVDLTNGQTKCVLSGNSTHNLYASSCIPNNISESSLSAQNEPLLKSILSQTAINGIYSDPEKPLTDRINSGPKCFVEKVASSCEKVAQEQFSFPSREPPKCDSKPLLPEELVSNKGACEVICIPVIDLVSSDEESEQI